MERTIFNSVCFKKVLKAEDNGYFSPYSLHPPFHIETESVSSARFMKIKIWVETFLLCFSIACPAFTKRYE